MEFHKRTENILRAIIGNDTVHARLLFTLSHLEYCGFRKIASCCPSRNPASFLLRHAAEEARHAFFLRRQMRKISTEESPPLLGGIPAKNYLNLLDVKISRLVKQKPACFGGPLKENVYPLITLVVEMRAMKFYPLYQKLLEEAGSPIGVKSIIAEEELHLREMERVTREKRLDNFVRDSLQIEKTLYNGFLTGMEEEIHCEKDQIHWHSL